jgi:hypothetical protein
MAARTRSWTAKAKATRRGQSPVNFYPARFAEFSRRYRAELIANKNALGVTWAGAQAASSHIGDGRAIRNAGGSRIEYAMGGTSHKFWLTILTIARWAREGA